MVKDYDVEFRYHPGHANVVADALSRKKLYSMTTYPHYNERILKDLEDEGVYLLDNDGEKDLVHLRYGPQLMEKIKEAQAQFKEAQKIREKISQNKEHPVFYIRDDDIICTKDSN